MIPCPEGTIDYADKSESIDDCQPCPPGSFCPFENADYPDYKAYPCPAGSYCMGGVSLPTLCPEGYYCPSDQSFPVPCSAGSYCDEEGLAQPKGKCTPGYWCTYLTLDPPHGMPFCAADEPCVTGATTAV